MGVLHLVRLSSLSRLVSFILTISMSIGNTLTNVLGRPLVFIEHGWVFLTWASPERLGDLPGNKLFNFFVFSLF